MGAGFLGWEEEEQGEEERKPEAGWEEEESVTGTRDHLHLHTTQQVGLLENQLTNLVFSSLNL